MYSIFYNLISNSIKYRHLDRNPVITISGYRSEKKITLLFEDNCKGIDLERYQNQLFGLYKRFDTTVEGKGMGLFMVKTQVETLGGKISVSSVPNEGTRFKIELNT